MTLAYPDEPDLHPGESSDAVQRLQHRLHALGLFAGTLDGYFGEDTAQALAHVLEPAGVPAAGYVDAAAWAAVAAAEQAAGIAPVDPQWHWDGESWQPATLGPAVAARAADVHVDASGQWVWDGDQWQPAGG